MMNELVSSALHEILRMAKDHACFDTDAFEKRDFEALRKQGGEIFDWTMVAILADNALKANEANRV